VECGIYAEILAGGTLASGDRLALEQASLAFA
jgi:MOSC domain-containing protein YiiM